MSATIGLLFTPKALYSRAQGREQRERTLGLECNAFGVKTDECYNRSALYAEGVILKSPGSRATRAHPGSLTGTQPYPERGCTRRPCATPFGVAYGARSYPGCARVARDPWALECNAFGVKTD